MNQTRFSYFILSFASIIYLDLNLNLIFTLLVEIILNVELFM